MYSFFSPFGSATICFSSFTEYRKSPPNSLHLQGNDSNPDYESLSPYEAEDQEDDERSVLGTLRRPTLAYIKEHSNDSSSDYESISSLDLGGFSRRTADAVVYANVTSNNSSHDYESIDNLAITTSIDMDPSDSPPITDSAMRIRLLKIDSHGYASVLYPHEEDESWEFDCLNQDRDQDGHQDPSPSSSHSNITVHNVEEAWKHQLAKGYAPLTMQQEPPPLFSRTRSAPINPHSFAKPEPLDYEVPVHLMQPPPPPPMIALRRISWLKQQQAAAASESTDGHLSDVQEEENSKETQGDTNTVPSRSQKNSIDAEAHARSGENERLKMRSRVMTAPTLSFQTFTVPK